MAGFIQPDKSESGLACEYPGTPSAVAPCGAYSPAQAAFAARKTASNIVAVSFPVAVF